MQWISKNYILKYDRTVVPPVRVSSKARLNFYAIVYLDSWSVEAKIPDGNEIKEVRIIGVQGGFEIRKANLKKNFSLDKNEITELTQDEFIDGNKKWQVGKSLFEFFMPMSAGVDFTDGYQMWYKDIITDGFRHLKFHFPNEKVPKNIVFLNRCPNPAKKNIVFSPVWVLKKGISLLSTFTSKKSFLVQTLSFSYNYGFNTKRETMEQT